MDKLCREKRQFYRDKKYQKGNTSQLRQVFLCCDIVSIIKPTQERTAVATKKIMSQHDSQNSQPRATQSLLQQRLFLSQQTKHEEGEFPIATIKSQGMIKLCRDREKKVAT